MQSGVRTYAVVPLNETCGIIEWVSNTAALRQILLKKYRQKDKFVPVSNIPFNSTLAVVVIDIICFIMFIALENQRMAGCCEGSPRLIPELSC